MRPTPNWWSHLTMEAKGEVPASSSPFLATPITPGTCALKFRSVPRPFSGIQIFCFVDFNQQMQVKTKVRQRWRMHEPSLCHALTILQNLRSAGCLSGFSGSRSAVFSCCRSAQGWSHSVVLELEGTDTPTKLSCLDIQSLAASRHLWPGPWEAFAQTKLCSLVVGQKVREGPGTLIACSLWILKLGMWFR